MPPPKRELPQHRLERSGRLVRVGAEHGDLLMRNASGDLERLTQGIPAARIEKLLTAFATPWDGICRATREQAADLIVIGSHGYGGLDRILGTTASKVVNRADGNVLVVRATM